jgi:hypothetical protein
VDPYIFWESGAYEDNQSGENVDKARRIKT